MPVDTTVLYTRIYEGPLHQRCYDIWDEVAAKTPRAEILGIPNDDEADHYEMLARMWKIGREKGRRYLILTEADFLPDLTWGDWIQAAIDDMGDAQALTPMHVEWVATTWEPVQNGEGCGASFQLYDLEAIPEDFEPTWREGLGDPNGLLYKYLDVCRVRGRQVHFSMVYPFGCHLFWSRAYNKEPISFDGGQVRMTLYHSYPLYCIQAAVAALLVRWSHVKRV